MEYEVSKYTRSRIEKAGKVISEFDEDSKEYNEYIAVVDNWRAAHAYPLDVVASIVNDEISAIVSDGNQNNGINVVKRIKRLESIVSKLKRPHNSGLFRMQDLGGCRVIVPHFNKIYETASRIKQRLEIEGHEIDRIDDYISKPRIKTGYRSYHIRVKFHEESTYDGMYIEIQIRTEQEHVWATSVEIMDATTNETLKSETGNVDYMYFFKLVSALFSIEEGTTVVEGVPDTEDEIMEELKRIEKKLSLRQLLAARNNAIKITDNAPAGSAYYLLITDIRRGQISISTFKQSEVNEALKEYERYEKERRSAGTDAVLVSARNFDIIRQCYPNYFMNTNMFLAKIRNYFVAYSNNNVFSTRGNGIKIADLFSAQYYKYNIPKDIKILDGIGQPDGDLVFCSNGAAIMEESYLRFSGIRIKRNVLPMEELSEPNIINGPAVIAMKTGACFYVDDTYAEIINEVDCIVIRCKKNTPKDMLLFLLGWSKSNICVWDLFYNLQANSIYRKEVFYKMEMPNPDKKMKSFICNNVELILWLEKEFVKDFDRMMKQSGEVEQIFVDDFNKKVSELLVYNEQQFSEYYNLSRGSLEAIHNDLKQMGFYVY